jgi:hypothetical protein
VGRLGKDRSACQSHHPWRVRNSFNRPKRSFCSRLDDSRLETYASAYSAAVRLLGFHRAQAQARRYLRPVHLLPARRVICVTAPTEKMCLGFGRTSHVGGDFRSRHGLAHQRPREQSHRPVFRLDGLGGFASTNVTWSCPTDNPRRPDARAPAARRADRACPTFSCERRADFSRPCGDFRLVKFSIRVVARPMPFQLH